MVAHNIRVVETTTSSSDAREGIKFLPSHRTGVLKKEKNKRKKSFFYYFKSSVFLSFIFLSRRRQRLHRYRRRCIAVQPDDKKEKGPKPFHLFFFLPSVARPEELGKKGSAFAQFRSTTTTTATANHLARTTSSMYGCI